MRITKRQLRKIVSKAKSSILSEKQLKRIVEQYGYGSSVETGSDLIEFAKAYAGLGSAVQEQVDAVVAAYNNSGGPGSLEFENVVAEQNINALELAQRNLSSSARNLGEDGESIIEALDAAVGGYSY